MSQLMHLLAVGASDEQIARCFGLSTKQVQRWIDRLQKRLGLSNRLELIFYAEERNQERSKFAGSSAA
jgi:DNA-binding CsgD family transcriptional regulator